MNSTEWSERIHGAVQDFLNDKRELAFTALHFTAVQRLVDLSKEVAFIDNRRELENTFDEMEMEIVISLSELTASKFAIDTAKRATEIVALLKPTSADILSDVAFILADREEYSGFTRVPEQLDSKKV